MNKFIITPIFTIALFFTQLTSKAQVALSFNGTNNYVSTNGSPVINNLPRTVDAWIKTTSTVSTQMVICDWGALSPNGHRFTFNMINSKLRIEVGGVGFAGTTNLNTGQWFHVTAVYSPSITSGSNAFLYINGVLEASGTFTGYPVLSTTTTVGFRIGVRVDGINFYQGAVDEVKVYDYARTQAQIAADTLEYCGPQPGLVAYYKLNEGVPNAVNTGSTTAIDYSGNNNNGTLNSFTLSGTSSNWVPGRITTGAPSLSVSPSANICAGTTVSLSTNAASNYTWSTGNSSSTLIAVSPSTSTIYSVSAINVQGCVVTRTLSLLVNNGLPTVTVSASQNPVCLGASTSFSASGASTYTWSGGIVNTQTFVPSTTNSYTLTAANGCGTINSVHTITVVPITVSTIASPTSVCQGYTCNLSASAAANAYTWTPGGQTGASILVSPSSNQIYTVTASNGTCMGTQTVQVSTKATPSIAISSTLVTLCEGQSTSVTATGAGTGGTYSWAPVSVTGSSVLVSPTTSTIFTVFGTNSLACTSSAQVPIVILAKPTFSAVASKTLACSGESVTLAANGASTYTWSSGANTASIIVNPPSAFNTYSVSATGTSNSCTATQTIGMSVITPSVTFTNSLSICNGASVTLNASGASTYSWNNVSAGSSGQQVVTPTLTTTYTLSANTQSGSTTCLSTYFATVTVNQNPTLSVIPTLTNTICRGLSNTLTVNGALTYTWVGSGSSSTSLIVTPSVTTTYTVSGQTLAGCESTAAVQVKVNTCNGINVQNEASMVLIYPNPASNEIVVSVENDLDLAIYNNEGKLILNKRLTSGLEKINIADLSRGVYIILAHDGSTSFSQKLIVQ